MNSLDVLQRKSRTFIKTLLRDRSLVRTTMGIAKSRGASIHHSLTVKNGRVVNSELNMRR